MQLEEVHFNHSPGTATGDAITICRDKLSGAIVAPEWKRSPVKREPAAYARDAITGPVTIKAKFSGGPKNAARNVRAIDATTPPVQKQGCAGFITWLIETLVRAIFGTNSEVVSTPVTFNGSGNSGLTSFQLNAPWLTSSGYVSKRNVVWRWQYDQNGTWTDFDTSDHTVYVSLGMPNAPWVQSGDASQLPWATALDQACSWAVLAQTADDVAARITRGVNQVPNVTYTPSTLFVDFATDSYELQAYLSALAGGAFQMNCTDCADAVTTLSNLLGCTLAEGQFGPLNTKTFLTLSGDPSIPGDWVSWNWGYHEICWQNDYASNTVWDGCLQLDMSNVPGTHVAQLPVKMAFDTVSPDDYKSRLIASGSGALKPPVRRRPVV
jgi:hypothetical protein